MDRVTIDGIVYEKVELNNWQDFNSPNDMHLSYLGRMYRLERVKPKEETKDKAIEKY